MAVIKTKGLVIRETSVSDTDKIITLLTEDCGKISVSAKGAKRPVSRSGYGTQIFTYGQYVLFKGNSTYSLNGCDTITQFYSLSSNLEGFTHAAHMIELASDAASDTQTTALVLNLLLHGLNALVKGRNPLLISSAFSIKLMQILGFPPHMTSCALCNTTEMETLHFSFAQCGILCDNCAKQAENTILLEPGTAKAILHILCSDHSNVYKFELSPDNLTALARIAGRYVSERLDKQYRKLDFLREIDFKYHY